MRVAWRLPAAGSSPRWRGKRGCCGLGEGADGLIPALAGKTGHMPRRSRLKPAHPRAGGENASFMRPAVIAGGSSPRWRGKPRRTSGCRPLGRLIPALAGKTARSPCAPAPHQAHPRAGGENEAGDEKGSTFDGSSPRWRGKRAHREVCCGAEGLIPALAGKTPSFIAPARAMRAHPRAGGENMVQAWRFQRSVGSSPRWRGKRGPALDARVCRRLIPALAGKTLGRRRTMSRRTAHPRAGGENPSPASAGAVQVGSSPRWRGKRAARQPRDAVRGLIPALAGKTTWGRGPCLRPSAHPRAGGENASQAPHVTTGMGSSPRWRGKRGGDSGGRRHRGLIPALAGKTGAVQVETGQPRAHPRAGGENTSSRA